MTTANWGSQITYGRVFVPRRTVIYGVQGIGKSMMAAGSHTPIFMSCEDGTRDLNVARFPLLGSYADAMSQIEWLRTEEHGFETLVIDTVDQLETHVNVEAGRRAGGIDIALEEFYNGWKRAVPIWREVLRALDVLIDQRRMAVIMLGHARTSKVKPPDGEEYTEYTMSLHADSQTNINQLIQAWADDVLFAFIPTQVRKVGASSKGKGGRNIATVDNRRVIRTTKTLAHYAKTRCPTLPSEFVLADPRKGENPFEFFASHVYAGTPWATVTNNMANIVPQEQVNYDTGEVAEAGVDQAEMDEVAAATESADDGAFCSDTVESVEGGG